MDDRHRLIVQSISVAMALRADVLTDTDANRLRSLLETAGTGPLEDAARALLHMRRGNPERCRAADHVFELARGALAPEPTAYAWQTRRDLQ